MGVILGKIFKIKCKTYFSFLIFTLCALYFSNNSTATPNKSIHGLYGIENADLYRTSKVNIETLIEIHRDLIQDAIDAFLEGSLDIFTDLSVKLSSQLKSKYNFSYASLTIIKYYNLNNIPGEKYFLTMDVVDEKDYKRTFNFLEAPAKKLNDPDHLLEQWSQYEKIGFELLQKGELDGKRVNCISFHCIFGHEHPHLKKFEEIFMHGVYKNQTLLEQILMDSEDANWRANSAFLLAYQPDGNRLMQTLKNRLMDPDKKVRNNILRVFSDLAHFHPKLELPLEDIIKMLDFPTTTDRNKSAAILFGVVNQKEKLKRYGNLIYEKALPHLRELAKLQQPNNRDFALAILRLLEHEHSRSKP